MKYLVIFLFSLAISILTIIFIKKIAIRFKIGSLPSPRKLHKGFKPLLGGIAYISGIFVAYLISQVLGILGSEIWYQYKYFWGGFLIITMFGLLDDVKSISSKFKFMGQSIAALLLISGGCQIQSFSGPMGETLSLGIFSIPFTFLWIIFVINSINLMDGLDGLAGGISLILTAGLILISVKINNTFLIILGIGLAGGLLGFLRYNYYPASIFMGEVGSLLLGYVLAFFSIETLKIAASHQVYFIASLVIFGVPMTDTLVSFLRRLNQGKSPFIADTEHIHHRLLKLRLTHIQTVWLLYIFTAFYVVIGVLMIYYKGILGLLLFMLAFLFAIFWIYRLGYVETRVSWQNLSHQFQRTGVVRSRAPLHFNRIWNILLLLISDIFAINIGLYLIYYLKFHSGLFPETVYRSASEYFFSPVFLFLLLGWIVLFYLNNLYHMDWDVSRFEKTMRVSKVITFGVLIIGFITADFQDIANRSQLFSLIAYWSIMLICVNSGRLLIIELQKRLRIFEYSPRNTLIIGCNDIGAKILQDIQYNPHLIFEIKGFVSKMVQKKTFQGLPVLGNYSSLPKLIHQHRIEEIIIALPERATEDFIQILSLCEPQQVKIKIPPGVYEFLSGHRRSLISHAYVQVFSENMVLWQYLLKRLFDIFFSTVMIILFLPLMALFSIVILLRFRKSIIVKLPVLGKYGLPFLMYVFRLTDEDYDYKKNPVYLGIGNLPQDAGKILNFFYRYRLYKLPQFVNVLLGDMSIVGPRPEPVEWFQAFSNKINFLHRRIAVRPGLTGLAQVKYHFELSQKTLKEWVKYDIFYIENMALRMDFGIFIRTSLLLIMKPYDRSTIKKKHKNQ